MSEPTEGDWNGPLREVVMRLCDLRAVYRCDACGDAEDHARPATVADLVAVLEAEGVGETIWWCEAHKSVGQGCDKASAMFAMSGSAGDCRMVLRRMIDIPEGAGT